MKHLHLLTLILFSLPITLFEQWKGLNEGSNGWLNSIDFINDDIGWIAGGMLYKTEDGGASWIDNEDKSISASNILPAHNYPNPFNPKTKISYQLPVTCDVELSVYNLLGQKMTTLISKRQVAGNYQVEWDASDYASGVYIYRLWTKGQSQNEVKSRKLVLLK